MNKILVPLKKHDRIEEMIPYIKELAEPGASVVFLIRHPLSGFKWLRAYCAIAQCGLEKTSAVRRMIESHSVKTRTELARRRVFQTCETLHDMDMNFTLDVYSGGLRKALERYASNGDPKLLVMRPGIGQRIMSALDGRASVRSVFGRSFSSYALLLHTGK